MDGADIRSIKNHVIALVVSDAVIAAFKYLLLLAEQFGTSIGRLHVIASAPIGVLLGVGSAMIVLSWALAFWVSPGIVAGLSRITRAKPLVRGQVMRFAIVDARDLSRDEFHELESELLSFAKTAGAIIGEEKRLWYVAWIQLECFKQSRATNWEFNAKSADGTKLIRATPTQKLWSAPNGWPKIGYFTLDSVQYGFLKPDETYNVLIFLTIPAAKYELGMDYFKATFLDGNGVPVECLLERTSP